MKLFLYIFYFLILSSALNAQTTFLKITSVSRPEKFWALFHPFVAPKAFKTTHKVWQFTDSIKTTGIIGKDNSGGKLDAFKHTLWIAAVSTSIGTKKALKLGVAHERGNKLQFKKQQSEDHILPDAISSCMDLYNNKQGAMIAKKYPKQTIHQLCDEALILLNKGNLLCILKDTQGNYLTCDSTVIDMKQWHGKWNIPKCLVKSGNL